MRPKQIHFPIRYASFPLQGISSVKGIWLLPAVLTFLCLFSMIVETMENWLQLMLDWDPQQRGGGINPVINRFRCFELMDHLLGLKVSSNTDLIK